MKLYLLLIYLLFPLVSTSQNDTSTVEVFPNPFTSEANLIIHLNEGDQLDVSFLNLFGAKKCSIPTKAYFKSQIIEEHVDSISAGVYFSFITINGERKNNKLIYTGNDSTFRLNFDIRVAPSPYEKETLKIFPNPGIEDFITIETETESASVEFFIFTMQGQLLFNKEVNSENKRARVQQDIVDWNTGQYVVKMKSRLGEDEKIFTKISR